MKSKLVATSAALILGLSGLGLSSTALAGNTKQLLTQQGCFACHAVSNKVVGPAFSWVAYRYHGNKADKKTVKMLAEQVIKGGAGKWNKWTGGIPMSPHPTMSLAQATEAVHWVLARKPVKAPAP